ncbi:MAG: hypothetical protein QXM08_07745 [Thermofilaceae archaeon]
MYVDSSGEAVMANSTVEECAQPSPIVPEQEGGLEVRGELLQPLKVHVQPVPRVAHGKR